MQPAMIELMRDQVHAIYRAVTGSNLPEGEAPPSEEGKATGEASSTDLDDLERRFVELETLARTLPSVAERVPPFSFTPLLDVMTVEGGVVLELALPGTDRADVEVTVEGEVLAVSGFRRADRAADGREYVHAEIPCGPFHRVVRLPIPVEGEPRVELERGLLRIHIAPATAAPEQQAQ